MATLNETLALKKKEIEGLQRDIAANQNLEVEYNKRIAEIEAEFERLCQFDDYLDVEVRRWMTLAVQEPFGSEQIGEA